MRASRRLCCGLILGLANCWPAQLMPAADDLPAAAASPALPADSPGVFEKQVRPFLHQYCTDCHGEDDRKAGLRLDTMSTDFLEGKTANVWKQVIDKLNVGSMPPKDAAPRPTAQESFVLVEWVNQELRRAEKRAHSTGRRLPMRRLNRSEYANSVRNLFFLDDSFARKIERELPGDGKVDGFDRGGAALLVDKSQLQIYLNVARQAVAEALPFDRPEVNKFRIDAAQDSWLTTTLPARITLGDIFTNPRLGLANDLRTFFDRHELDRTIDIGKQANDFTVRRDGGLEVSVNSNILGYAQGVWQSRRVVKQDGVYRIRIRAGADRGSGKHAVDAVQVKADYCERLWNRASTTITIDAPLDSPKVFEQDIFLQSGGANFNRELYYRWNSFYPFISYLDPRSPLLGFHDQFLTHWNAVHNAGAEFDRSLGKASPERLAELRSKRDKAIGELREFLLAFPGPLCVVKPDVELKALPRLWYEYIELEGPFTEWPTKANREIFFNGEQGDADDARQIFRRFLPRAYRRPVDDAEIDDLVQSVVGMQNRLGMTFGQAVRAAIATVLSSPDFLYLEEPTVDNDAPRELNAYQLASRLSYFLWSSIPDAELLDLAAKGKLSDPGVLRTQVQRMAADPKARQFVENFAGQWLRVREFDSVMVDNRFQYRNYDDALRESGRREPVEFFLELLRSDLSVVNILDSDFLVINERLARHYGIGGVTGPEFRRVAIKPEHHRGGILGMAGVLTYLSDGFRTTPVKRGAYVLDVLWNTPAPLPPPDAGDLPPVRNARTVRERLEQHRNRDVCASCHVKIDPLGLGLENYDAIGAWRERQNGEGRRGELTDPPIDASGTMPGGRRFANLAEYKQAICAEQERFLRSFTEKLLAYALGRPIGVTDREMVERIISRAARQDNRLSEFLQAVVAEPEFRSR